MQTQRLQSALYQVSGPPQRDALHPFVQRKNCCTCPAIIAHRWIRLSHGHTKLYFGDMALRLGLDLRSLQRSFVSAYGISMKRCATVERIKFVRKTWKTFPDTKVAVLALELGYKSDKAFMRFATSHNVKTPHQCPNCEEGTSSIQRSA